MENAMLTRLDVGSQQIKKPLWTQKLTRTDGHHLNRFFTYYTFAHLNCCMLTIKMVVYNYMLETYGGSID